MSERRNVPTDRLRYGVVGAGRVFQRFHLPAVTGHPDYALVAICDADPAQARATVGDAGRDAVFTDSLTEFFASGRLDVVAVCTPNDSHVAPVLAALAAGAAVLCEKPLAAGLPDAERIAAAAGTSVLGVNLPYRFHPLLPAFREEIGGPPDRVTLTFTTAGQRLWRPVTKWYGDPARAGGGALLDLGPHALDLLTALFGTPEVVGCRLDGEPVEERVDAEVRFGRTLAHLVVDRAARTMGLTVEAEAGGRTVTLDLRRNEVRAGADVVARSDGAGVERAAIDRFLDAVAGRGGEVVGVAEAVALQRLIEQMYGSAKGVEAP
ncbi:Gfo/Idh/MocA family protein [Plantactinospora sp. CA-290183]|uniref:Gfo/Idh/MocA family protein n=1 Tax=Plantactinospora sp. CA-290183 TaxID=3240006 RepID=UPI003D8D4D29